MPPDTATLAVRLPHPPVTLDRPIALFLDLDGVLAPLVATPDAVGPDPRRTAVLQALDRVLQGRVAVVSGRTLAEIDRIAERAAPSASGVHGLERRRRDGTILRAQPAPQVAEAVSAFHAFAAEWPGVIVEDKGVSAGLHFRQAPASAAKAVDLARAIERDTGLALQPGHMVLELKTPGTDKGQALSAFMSEQPFLGGLPVMVGDDLTDEAGFIAAGRLGGFGVLVGSERPTAARYRLPGVPEVMTWLEAIVAEARS